jgi:hypothetical protein
MFWRFFKNKQKEASSPSWLDALQATTRNWGIRISAWLQRKTMTLSPVRLKLYVAGFLLLFGIWNGEIIYHALQGHRLPTQARQLSLSHPTIPAVQPPVDPAFSAGIGKFRSWLDSLQADSVGRQIYDSIRRERPGLLDSVAQLDNGYSIHH